MSQHMDALERANEVRLERAELKRKILANDKVLLRSLEDPPQCIMSAPISEMLRAQRRWGHTRSRKFLTNLGIKEGRKVEELTARQRDQIVAALEHKRSARGGWDV